MPQAIPYIVQAVIGEVIAVTVTSKVIGSLLFAAAAGTLSKLMADRELKSTLERARQQGREINVIGNAEPIPIIYGEVYRTSAAVAYMGTSSRVISTSTRDGRPRRGDAHFLNIVLVWGEGVIQQVTRIWLDDYPADDERFDDHRHDDYERYVVLEHYLGTDTQTASAELIERTEFELAGQAPVIPWTVDHRLRGTAYTYAQLHFNFDLFETLPVVTADLTGIVPAHPTLGTPTVVGNPAWAVWDYMTNARYGLGFAAADLDLPSFEAAAAYCDDVVGRTTRRYTIGGLLSPDAGRLDNLRALLSGCRGAIIQSGGRFKMYVDRAAAAVMDIDETMVVGEMSIQLDAHGSRFNSVRARFVNDQRASKPDFVIVESAEYLAADNGEPLQLDLELPMTSSAAVARDIATQLLIQSRYGMVVQLEVTLAAIAVECGDVVRLTHSVPGWTLKLFRVVRFALGDSGATQLTLQEYSADVYSTAPSLDNEDPPGTDLPDPFDVLPVETLTLTPDRLDRGDGTFDQIIRMEWTPPPDDHRIGFDIEWGKTADGVDGHSWSSISVLRPDAINHVVVGLVLNTEYTVRIRTRNSIGVVSPWVTGTATTLVGGNISPLLDVSGSLDGSDLTIAWVRPPDTRASLVEVWRGVGPDFFEGFGPTLLTTAPITDGSIVVGAESAPSVYNYYWLRTRSTSGSLSPDWVPSQYGPGISAVTL